MGAEGEKVMDRLTSPETAISGLEATAGGPRETLLEGLAAALGCRKTHSVLVSLSVNSVAAAVAVVCCC